MTVLNLRSADRDTVRLTVNPNSTLGVLQFFSLPTSNSPLSAIQLETVTYNCASKELSVVTRSYGHQVVIPGVVEVQDVTIQVTAVLSDINTLTILFNGVWRVDGVGIQMGASYIHSTQTLEITATPSDPINLGTLATELTGVSLPNPLGRSLTFSDLTMSGTITARGDATLIISTVSTTSDMYIVLRKPSNDSIIKKALAVEFTSVSLSSLIQDVTGQDISQIPFFGSVLVRTIALTISSSDMNGVSFPNSPLLNANATSIEEGIVAYIQFDFVDEPIKVVIDESITLQPTVRGLSVNTLLSAMNVGSIPLPLGLTSITNLNIANIELQPLDRNVYIEVVYPTTLTPINGVSITDPILYINITRGQPARLSIGGDLSISGSGFDATIARDGITGNYILTASANTLPISNAIQQFQPIVLPSELNSLLGGLPFFSFSINNPTLSLPLASPLQLQIGGVPVISGYNTLHMDAVILRRHGRTLLIEGFELGSVNLGRLIRTVTGVDLRSVAFLNQDLDAAILISPVTLPDVQLTGQRLGQFSITKGISVQAVMQFPPGCSSDAFCAVAQFLLGSDTQMTLQGTVTSASSFTLFAGLSDIRLGNGLTMSQAGVEIQGGVRNSVGIVGAVDLSNPDITFAGRVFLSTSGVVLDLSMSGCWENAFGANWLDICNLHSSVAMVPGVTITGLALGGQVRIGDETCGSPLIGSGFVGIDAVTPSENYYYVNVEGETTVTSVLNALCINVSMPRPLGESGFPNGFMSSFSLAEKELPQLTIPQGYRLNGTLNILGLVGSADVTIGLPNGIDFAVTLPPVNIANGLLRMYASQSDRSNGPFLTADIDLLPSLRVDITASGYLSVLGISLNTQLRITNTTYEFNIEGRMLDLFEARLYIYASYGNVSSTQFRVRGNFRNDLYTRIETLIKSTLQSSANTATTAIDGAQRVVNNRRQALNRANNDLRSAQNEVNRANSAFDSAIREVRRVENQLNSACRIRSCRSVCFGCFDGTSCCGRIFGRCVCRRPRWNGCCRRVTDPICLAGNTACRGLRATISATLSSARRVVDESRRSLDAANAALNGARGVVNTAQVGLRAANLALEAAQRTYQVGSRAAAEIARVGVNGLISIREIQFDAELSVAAGGSFSGKVTASFLGTADVTVSLNINMNDVAAMARQLANQIGDGLSGLF